MALFNDPFSLELSVRIGNLELSVFINENIYMTNKESVSTPHKHPDYELWYVESGVAYETVDKQCYRLIEKDFILIPPLHTHFQNVGYDDIPSTHYNFRFSIKTPKKSDRQTQQTQAIQSLLAHLQTERFFHDADGIINTFFKQITMEIYHKKAGYVHVIRTLSSLILTEVFRLLGAEALREIFPMDELRYHGYEKTRIDEFFRRKFYLPDVQITDLAKDMQVSTRQVNRVLYKMFGMSFTKKLRQMRLQYATLLLKDSDKTMSEICQRCGFRNYPYFEVCFLREYDMTPTEYRELEKKKRETESCL